MSGASIRLEHVRFGYAGEATMELDLGVEAGERVVLMGPSGSGKTTILSLIAGFESPASGRVLIGEREMAGLAPAQRPVSMIFQENNLFAHLDVAANVGLGRSPSLRLNADDRDDVARALERTGLAGKERRLPSELSGGERQRVALARVLVRRRPVLLLDEAFAALGPALRDEMLDLVLKLHTEQKMTILDATHDPLEAARLAEKIVFVEAGRAVAGGAAADFLSGYGPEGFRRYLGAEEQLRRIADAARKPT